MTTPPEESELQNGTVHEPEPELESKQETESAPTAAQEVESAGTADADPKTEEAELNRPAEIQSCGPNSSPPAEEPARPQLKKDEGNRTFTMRELLNELKTDEKEVNSPYRLVL